MLRYGLLLPLAILGFVNTSCDHASFTYVDNDRPRPVRVIEHRPVEEVHVIHSAPVREVHVVEAPVREVYVNERHICGPGCDHYYDGGRYLVVSHGHRHGPGCGHYFDGRRWSIEVHKGKAQGPPPRKYRRD